MKKKGFVFVETIVVTVVLTIALLLIYITFTNVLNNERKRLTYEDTGYLYKTYSIMDFLKSVYLENYINEYFIKGNQEIRVLGCNDLALYKNENENVDDSGNIKEISVCEKVVNDPISFNVNKIYITKYNLDNIKKCTTNLRNTDGFKNACKDESIRKALENVNINFAYYLRTISSSTSSDFDDAYRIIVEYKESALDEDNPIDPNNGKCIKDYELNTSNNKCYRRINKYYYDNLVFHSKAINKIQWYYVYFNLTYGEIISGNINKYTVGVGATLPTNVVRNGYDFAGWYENSLLTGERKTAIGPTEIGNKYYWAKWTPKYYRLSYDNNGGSGCYSQTAQYDDVWGDLCTPSKSGYLFAGWYTEDDGLGAEIKSTTTVSGDLEAHAKWVANGYALNYDNQGGFGCSRTVGNYGQQWGTLCVPYRDNYSFGGWFVGTNGTGQEVKAESIVSGTLTVYAKWTPNNFTLRYDSQGGSSCTNKTAAYNSTWGTLCSPNKANYSFGGWYTGVNGGGDNVTSSTTVSGDLIVYAKWNPSSFTLTYDSQGGSACSSKSGVYGQSWGTLCSPSKDKYNFAGWYTGINGSGALVIDDSVVAGNLNVYAKWTPRDYVLTYNNQGGSGCFEDSGTYGSTWGTLCTPEKNNYNFAGWYTGTEGSGQEVKSTTPVTGDLTAYAKWSPKNYTLYYHSEGGTACTNKSRPYGSTWGDLCSPTKDYYNFDNWYTQSDGLGDRIYSTSEVNGDLAIYANWIPRNYTLTYNSQGGSSCGPKTAAYNSTWGTLCEPYKSNYSFGGWFVGTNGTGVQVKSDTKVLGDQTVNAFWNPDSYPVVLNTNGGTIEGTNVTSYRYGEGAVLPRNVVKDHYEFKGWYDNKYLTGSAVLSIGTADSGRKEYWAKWEKKTYTLYYDDYSSLNCPESKSVLALEPWGQLCTPYKAGYDFVEWIALWTGDTITSSTTATYDVRVWAHFKESDKPNQNVHMYYKNFDRTENYPIAYGGCIQIDIEEGYIPADKIKPYIDYVTCDNNYSVTANTGMGNYTPQRVKICNNNQQRDSNCNLYFRCLNKGIRIPPSDGHIVTKVNGSRIYSEEIYYVSYNNYIKVSNEADTGWYLDTIHDNDFTGNTLLTHTNTDHSIYKEEVTFMNSNTICEDNLDVAINLYRTTGCTHGFNVRISGRDAAKTYVNGTRIYEDTLYYIAYGESLTITYEADSGKYLSSLSSNTFTNNFLNNYANTDQSVYKEVVVISNNNTTCGDNNLTATNTIYRR